MVRTWLVVALLALGACGGKPSGSSTASNSAARPRPQTEGRGGLAQEATRAVEIRMDDGLRFNPATVAVKKGEVVTFHVVNTGKTMHEFTIGGQDAQDLHEAQMAQMAMTGQMSDGTMDLSGGHPRTPGLSSMDHAKMPDTPEHRKYMKALAERVTRLDRTAAANASVHVPPGESRDLTWAFLGDQVPVFGCHVAQHWSAGMRGSIVWAG
jgi:uncharacterized cupredoxin-like copper-binding protein